MRPSLAYSLARLGVFAACLGIGWLVGLRDPLVLLLVAATVSMLISLFFLARLRDRFSADVADRIDERRARKHPERAGAAPAATTKRGSAKKAGPASASGTGTGTDEEDAEADSFR